MRKAIASGALKLLGETIAKNHPTAVVQLKQAIATAAAAEVT